MRGFRVLRFLSTVVLQFLSISEIETHQANPYMMIYVHDDDLESYA